MTMVLNQVRVVTTSNQSIKKILTGSQNCLRINLIDTILIQ